MKRVKSLLSAVPAAAVIVAVLFAASCSYDLLPEPEIEQIQGAVVNKDSQIEAPVVLKASQGKCREVSLSWTGSSAATQYLIYSASSLFDTFKQVGETADAATTFDLKEEAGTMAYYRVCAKDYNGRVSSFSETVQGSTMATPVITAIASSADGTSATIDWYMENCTDDTYKTYTIYDIVCTNENGEIVAQETLNAVEAVATQITIAGLQPKTTYYYEVSAYSSQYTDDSKETSSRVSQETLRLSIPNAPIDLAASKGTSADTITLEWTLPAFCEISASGGAYTKNPLYFTIERKPESAADSAYKKIVSYLGTITETSEDKSKICFTCVGDESDDDGIIQKEAVKDLIQVHSVNLDVIEESGIEAYKNYIPSYAIMYFDRNVERGQKYTYRVQSYVDGTAKKITADMSIATATGNLISKFGFNPNSAYEQDGTKILSVKVSFKTDFDALGQNYNYALVRMFSPAEINGTQTGSAPTVIKEFDRLDQLASYRDKFDFEQNPDTVQGYYQYVLYVCNDGTADFLAGKSDEVKITEYERLAIASVRQGGKTAVLNDSSLMPKLERFDVKDGYKDKFILSWNYEDACEYTVFWKSNDSDEEHSQAVPTGDINVDESTRTATFEHEAASGETRTYRLRAYAGMESEKTCDDEAGHLRVVETLGTADPVMDTVSYDSISVTWAAVRKAIKGYAVEAAYEGGESIITDETTVDYEENDGTVTCVITKPKGYDNPALSGKPVTLKVSAKSDVDESTGDCTVRTLGPALVNAGTNADDKAITLTWNKVEGAKGYLIYRTMYDPAGKYIAAADTYYYDIESKEIKANGQKLPDSKRVTVDDSAGTTISLTDSYCDAENDSAYQKHQETIFWGDPFGYTVLPVLTEDDFTFGYDGSAVKLDESTVDVDYTANGNLASKMGATTGYASGVKAEKSQSATKQKIRWVAKQYKPGSPHVFRRRYGTTDAFQRVEVNVPNDTLTSISLDYEVSEKDKYTPFEYIVKYGNDTSILNEDVPSALIKTFKGTPDTRYTYRSDTEIEPCYKGYLFTMIDIDECNLTAEWAKEGNPFAEHVTWSTKIPWDYASRAVGPSGVAVFIRNNNINADWHEVVRFSTLPPTDDNKTVSGTDITVNVDTNANGIYLAPSNITAGSSGTTDGMLKVLRDYKHYYAISFTRDDFETQMYTPGFGDYSDKTAVYAYRQITDEELVRAATLAMTIGMENAYNNNSSTWSRAGNPSRNYTTKNNGSVSFKSTTGSPFHVITYTNFTPSVIIAGNNTIDSFLTLNGTLTGTVSTTTDSCPPEKYNGTITISSTIDMYNNVELKFTDLKKDNVGISCRNSDFSNITPLPFKPDDYKYILGIGSVITAFSGHNNDAEWQ